MWPLLFPAPGRALPVLSFFLLTAMGLVVLGFLWSGASLVRQRSLRKRILGCAVLISLIVQAAWFQRATNVGLLALGGSAYWVDRAARMESDEAKRNAIGMALHGTEYALNLTERHVLEAYADQPDVQADLFHVMADAAYVDAWSRRYLAWSQHFEEIAGSRQNSPQR